MLSRVVLTQKPFKMYGLRVVRVKLRNHVGQLRLRQILPATNVEYQALECWVKPSQKWGPRQPGNGHMAMLDLSKSAQACAELLDVDCATAIAVKLVEGLAKVFHLLTTPVSSRHRR